MTPKRFLKILAETLDEMEPKRLAFKTLIDEHGNTCALGAFCLAIAADKNKWNDLNVWELAACLDITPALVAKICSINDKNIKMESPDHRWKRMRRWIDKQLI